MPHLLRLLIILPALLLILPASAQEPVRNFRTIRILFLNAPQSAPKTAHLHDGRSCRAVDLPRMNLSAIYEVPAGPLNLRLLAQAIQDPMQIPAQAPAVLIPESIGDAYLLCMSDPANPVLPVRIEVVDAGKENFRDGMMLWFNLTPHAVAGMLGKEKVRLRPQERALVNAPVSEADSYPVVVLHMIKGDEQVYPICETRWMHDPRVRQLVFVFMEPGRRIPRVQGFSDFRPPQPEKTPADTP